MRTATASRTKSERRRSDMRSRFEAYSGPRGAAGGTDGPSLLGRGQDEQQAAVIIVGREQIRNRSGGEVALRVDGHSLPEPADAPLERHPDMVLIAFEVQPQHVAHRAADDLLVREP